MNPYKVQADDIVKLQAEQGAACPQFKWNGQWYKILPGSAQNNYPLRSGGFSFAFDLKFTAVVSQFLNQKITDAGILAKTLANTPMLYLGQNWKIQNVTILAGATLIQVEANSKNQNA